MSKRAAGPVPTVLAIVVATLASVGVNFGIAQLGLAAGTPADFGPFLLGSYSLFSVIGVVVGSIGFLLIWRFAPKGRLGLQILVPVLLVASFIPDLQFLNLGSLGPLPALLLMLMHVVCAAAVVLAMAATGRPLYGGRRHRL